MHHDFKPCCGKKQQEWYCFKRQPRFKFKEQQEHCCYKMRHDFSPRRCSQPKKEQLVVHSPVIKCITISNHIVARSNRNGTALKSNHDCNSTSDKNSAAIKCVTISAQGAGPRPRQRHTCGKRGEIDGDDRGRKARKAAATTTTTMTVQSKSWRWCGLLFFMNPLRFYGTVRFDRVKLQDGSTV